MSASVLLTGGTGFLGAATVSEMAAQNVEFVYTYRRRPLEEFEAQGIKLDILNGDAFTAYVNTLAGVTTVVHAAANVSHAQNQLADDIQAHIVDMAVGLKNIVSGLPKLEKIILISSCSAAIAEADASFYGLGKKFSEEMLAHITRQQQLTCIALRFPQLYGPHEPHGTFISRFIDAIQQDNNIRLVNNGALTRDVLYVKDAAGSIMQAIRSDLNGTFTITDPHKYTVREVLDMLLKLRPDSKTTVENIIQDNAAKAQQSYVFESTTEALGYKLRYTLEQGLQEALNNRGTH